MGGGALPPCIMERKNDELQYYMGKKHQHISLALQFEESHFIYPLSKKNIYKNNMLMQNMTFKGTEMMT